MTLPEPREPEHECSACDKPTYRTKSGVLMHTDGSGHEVWPWEPGYEAMFEEDPDE